MLRRFAATLVVAASTVVAVGLAGPAYASNAGSFLQMINADRGRAGRTPLANRADINAIALHHSQTMAAENSLHHNAKLTSQVPGWQAVGENVGMGGNTRVLHTAFMNSPAHRSNILDKDFTEIGLGVVVDARGVMWVTEVFRQPLRSAISGVHNRAATAPAVTKAPAATAVRPVAKRPVATKRPAVRWATPGAAPRAHRPAKSAWLTRLSTAAAAPGPRATGALDQAVGYLHVVAG